MCQIQNAKVAIVQKINLKKDVKKTGLGPRNSKTLLEQLKAGTDLPPLPPKQRARPRRRTARHLGHRGRRQGRRQTPRNHNPDNGAEHAPPPKPSVPNTNDQKSPALRTKLSSLLTKRMVPHITCWHPCLKSHRDCREHPDPPSQLNPPGAGRLWSSLRLGAENAMLR